ncbi:hypothetical protein [Amycolatopsis sp. NPDC049159]|uniref:hypothetical protein n=1 Tax=Amycolatopsis sp. NPDC049159 TaxID=3157210 RepID=UPI0033E0624C
MTALGDHAIYELTYQGITGTDYDNIVNIVGTFADYTDPVERDGILQKVLLLLGFKPLSPLTNESAQWVDRSPTIGGNPLWQSKRDPDAFSRDGGLNYFYASQTGAPFQADDAP